MESSFDAFKRHTLADLNRHTRRLIATSQRRFRKARKADNTSGTHVSLERKTKLKICDKCGSAVGVDADPEVDTDSEVDAESKGDSEPEADSESQVDAELEEIPNHVCDTAKQAEAARMIRESRLSILKGKSDYKAWAEDFQNVLSREGIAYVLTPYTPLDNALKQYDDWVARKIIYAHISTARADRLRRSKENIKFAWHVWLQLSSDVLRCPCNDLKEAVSNPYQDLAKYQESAEDGCSSCKLILDAVEAYSPGWISPSNFSKKGKFISSNVSSYLIVVKLAGGHISGRHFEFFVQPGE
jgi:hypothetical protein